MLPIINTFEIIEGVEPHVIQLSCLTCPGGLIVSLVGGEFPHVGGVVLSVPRDSLTGEGRSENTWNIPIAGHLDNEVGFPFAKKLCTFCDQPVSLTSGIHIDNATSSDLQIIEANCDKAFDQLLVLLEEKGYKKI